MGSLQKKDIDEIVEKGCPDLLSTRLPPILYHLIVNKIMSNHKRKWRENINIVHLDLLLQRNKISLNIEIKRGKLFFNYSIPLEDGKQFINKFHDKELYDITIRYLTKKGLYENIKKDLEIAKSTYTKKNEVKLR